MFPDIYSVDRLGSHFVWSTFFLSGQIIKIIQTKLNSSTRKIKFITIPLTSAAASHRYFRSCFHLIIYLKTFLKWEIFVELPCESFQPFYCCRYLYFVWKWSDCGRGKSFFVLSNMFILNRTMLEKFFYGVLEISRFHMFKFLPQSSKNTKQNLLNSCW